MLGTMSPCQKPELRPAMSLIDHLLIEGHTHQAVWQKLNQGRLLHIRQDLAWWPHVRWRIKCWCGITYKWPHHSAYSWNAQLMFVSGSCQPISLSASVLVLFSLPFKFKLVSAKFTWSSSSHLNHCIALHPLSASGPQWFTKPPVGCSIHMWFSNATLCQMIAFLKSNQEKITALLLNQ